MSGNTESIHRCAFECIMIMILMMICSKRKAVQKKSRPEVIELHFVSFLRAVCTFYNPLEADHAPGHLLRILHIFFKYFKLLSDYSKLFLRVFQSIFQSFPKYFSDCPKVFFRIFQRFFSVSFSFSQFAFLNTLEAICPESSFSCLISRVLVFCTVPATRLDILALDSSLTQLTKDKKTF